MRIKEITIGASRTVNLGNYNSLKVEGRCTVELPVTFDMEEQSVQEEMLAKARSTAVSEVKVQMEEAFEQFKPKSAK